MSLRRRLRASPIVWLGPLMLVLAVLFLAMQSTVPQGVASRLGAVAGSTQYLIFSCGLVAVASVIEVSRLRRSRVLRGTLVRTRASVLADVLWPGLAAAILLQGLFLGEGLLRTLGVPGAFPWELLLAQMAIILFHLTLGVLAGAVLPAIVAPAAALTASFVWLGFTWGIAFVPLRYLSGLALSQCCSVDESVDQNAVMTAILFSVVAGAGLLALAVMFLPGHALPSRIVGAGTSLLLVVTGAAGGIALARDVDVVPVLPRPLAELHCAGSDPEVCLFPEIERVPWFRSVIADAARNLREEGMDVPRRIAAASGAYDEANSDSGVAFMSARSFLQPRNTIYSFVSASYFSRGVVADCGSMEDDDHRSSAASAAVTWLIDVASRGIVNEPFLASYGGEKTEEYSARLHSLSAQEQRDWVVQTLDRLSDCEREVVAP